MLLTLGKKRLGQIGGIHRSPFRSQKPYARFLLLVFAIYEQRVVKKRPNGCTFKTVWFLAQVWRCDTDSSVEYLEQLRQSNSHILPNQRYEKKCEKCTGLFTTDRRDQVFKLTDE